MAEETDPNVLYNLSGDLWTAQVLSESEVDAAVTALLSDDPARQGEVYRNLDFAKGRWTNLDEEEAGSSGQNSTTSAAPTASFPK